MKAIASYFRKFYAPALPKPEAFRREQIGAATLWLGDCREVMRLLPEASVDLIWTDPPYGHSNHDGDWNARLNDHRGIEQQPIANDDPDGMREVVDAMLREAVNVLKPDCCCCCCCCGGGPKPTFAWVADRMDRDGLSFFHSVIWDKKNPGLGWRYRRQHEMVMVAHRTGGKLAWADEGVTARNVFAMMPPREREHPNEKPLEMVMHFLNLHSRPGDLVLDPFMGSGTTGAAALAMGRQFIGIELDPAHFETACRRVEEATRQADLFVAPITPSEEQMPLLEAPTHAQKEETDPGATGEPSGRDTPEGGRGSPRKARRKRRSPKTELRNTEDAQQ